MKYIFTLIFFLLSFININAQKNNTVKGLAFDTLAKQPVAFATVTLLLKKDSSLINFTMTDEKGAFELKNIPAGEYRILITHTNYHNTNKVFTAGDDNKTIDIGNITMNDVHKTLSEVIVTSEAPPVTLVGDTVQYNAGSFKVQPNASVEQLLKKLPGVKVEKDGTVKAQGETVSKVLVDGKEFFGNDPKIATKNLPADMVDKVQVYDKQSDQAQLTGFDDGNSEKTINLKLKKDKKKGKFGKVMGGGGTNERYEGRFNVNSFKGARQMSAIGMGNNTNAEGFSFMDMMNFTGELSRMMRGGGGGGNININISNDGTGASNNTGINTNWAGGFNYNNIIGKKTDLQSNYFYSRYNPNLQSKIQRQYFLPDSSYFYNQSGYNNNINNSHRLNFTVEHIIDSFNSIKFTPSIGLQKTNNRSFSDYITQSDDGIKNNEGFSNNTSNSEGYNLRNDIIFRKKFRSKKGRTFSLNLQTTANQSSGESELESINRFYTPAGLLQRIDSFNQRGTNESMLRGYTARAAYTEPVFKRSLIEFSIAKSNTKNTSDKTTLDYNKLTGKFDKPNNLLTNNFENLYGYSNAGLRFRTQKKKYNYSFGAIIQQAGLEGKIINTGKDSVIKKIFTNLLPNARFQYYFTKFKNLTLSYTASTNQPTISQLQPVPDISDPLNIKEGNPDLQQEYRNTVNMNFMAVNPFRNKNMFSQLSFTQTKNKIINAITDVGGIKTTRPVNVDGLYTISGNIDGGLPLRFLKGTINIGTNATYNRNKQFINGVLNKINNISRGHTVNIETNPTEKINLSFNAGVSNTNTAYSLQPALNTKYNTYRLGTDVNWELPKGFFFATDFNYSINKTSGNERAGNFNINVPMWNASISKQLLKFNRGELKFSVNDLLNQNIGISRSSNQNYIEDNQTNNLRRFFLLSFTYSLAKTGLTNDGGGHGGNMRIIAR
jgi:Outer membrane protein beta-barrel family/CarboxypepD_reg-like domain